MLRQPDYGEGRSQEQFPRQEHLVHVSEQALANTFLKQQLLKEGRYEEASRIRPLVFFTGGGHAVSTEVGAAKVMYEHGWYNGVVNWVMGASGGAVVAAHALTGDTGAVGIFKSNCDKKFAHIRNIPNGGLVNFREFLKTLREFPVDTKQLATSQTKLIVYTMKKYADEGFRLVGHELTDTTRYPDPEIILHASCLIPEVGDQKHAEVGGEIHIDGGTRGIPIEDIKSYNPTDVIIVSSGPIVKSRLGEIFANLADKISYHRRVKNPVHQEALRSFRRGAVSMDQAFHMNDQKTGDGEIHVSILAPESSIVGMFTSEWNKIEHAIQESERSAQEIFDRIAASVVVPPAQRQIA